MVMTGHSGVDERSKWAEMQFVFAERRKIKKITFFETNILRPIKTSFCTTFDAVSEFVISMFIYLCFHHVRDAQSLNLKTFLFCHFLIVCFSSGRARNWSGGNDTMPFHLLSTSILLLYILFISMYVFISFLHFL